jgi:group I intron endonuclease
MGYIYRITNNLNGKQYVGQTLHPDIHTRWNQHKRKCKTMLGRCLFNAYVKHGIENFKFEIVCICFDEACNELEEFYIEKFNTLSPNGYNLKSGGKNSRQNEETKKLISEKKKGVPSTIVYTDEMRKARSERKMGSKNHNFGKPVSTEQRSAISEKMKQIWKEKKEAGFVQSKTVIQALVKGRTEQRKAVIKKAKVVSKGRKQRVGKYDDYGTLLEEFESIQTAAIKTGAKPSVISSVCRGVKKRAGGFKWKFLDVELMDFKRNNSTGEKYITMDKGAFIVRIKRGILLNHWSRHHTIQDAIVMRDKVIKILPEQLR